MNSPYSPEPYWDAVAEQIIKRNSGVFIAGDDDPYYQYKREKFLRLLNSIPFKGKTVIEIGPGPGGNLLEIYKHNPQELVGADISEQMIDISRKTVGERNIMLVKIDGKKLPFISKKFNLALTSTVLQHITDEPTLFKLVSEICRISEEDIYIFERIEKKEKKDDSNTGRTTAQYAALFKKHSYLVVEIKFLNIHWSYLVCGTIRKLFNNKKRKEGEPPSKISVFIQKLLLPITKRADNIIKVKRELAMLHFKKIKPELTE